MLSPLSVIAESLRLTRPLKKETSIWRPVLSNDGPEQRVLATPKSYHSLPVRNPRRPMTHYKDPRSYLTALQAIGELQAIAHPVELDLEIGAISRRAGETGQAAPLFENIRGKDGFRVLGAPGGISSKPGQWLARIAMAVGLPSTASGRDIVETFAAARGKPMIPPRIVETGPCKENIQTGEQFDLGELPAPLLHEGDGGRYLNTFGIICCETPDKSWRSWSIARIMVVDGKRMAGIIEVIKAETVDVLVPATAEIVVEGYVSQTETAPEGPMGEYAGYLWEGPPTPKPVYNVTAITHRDRAILPISVAGEPPEENHTAWGIPNAGEIVFLLREAGFPVATAWSPLESANHWFVIAVDRDWRSKTGLRSDELCRRVAEILFEKKAGMGTPKYIVVNDDVDITNTKEVVWAFATRNHPGSQGQLIYNDENANPLIAYIDDAEKSSSRTTKVIYNCLDPEHLHGKLPKRSSFHFAYPAEIQQRVLDNWTSYGYSADGALKESVTP
jgi:3-polyprenyl-4-hydroxybenzoate decarboxylase